MEGKRKLLVWFAVAAICLVAVVFNFIKAPAGGGTDIPSNARDVLVTITLGFWVANWGEWREKAKLKLGEMKEKS